MIPFSLLAVLFIQKQSPHCAPGARGPFLKTGKDFNQTADAVRTQVAFWFYFLRLKPLVKLNKCTEGGGEGNYDLILVFFNR